MVQQVGYRRAFPKAATCCHEAVSIQPLGVPHRSGHLRAVLPPLANFKGRPPRSRLGQVAPCSPRAAGHGSVPGAAQRGVSHQVSNASRSHARLTPPPPRGRANKRQPLQVSAYVTVLRKAWRRPRRAEHAPYAPDAARDPEVERCQLERRRTVVMGT